MKSRRFGRRGSRSISGDANMFVLPDEDRRVALVRKRGRLSWAALGARGRSTIDGQRIGGVADCNFVI